MTQTSGPVSQGTLAERQFSDVLWRDLFGGEPGVVGDLDGTAYAIALPPDSDTATIGSSTQNSLATVAGFVHKIPAGDPEELTIPVASGSARTDLIVVRYDPANTGAPGPCRLARIAGTSAGQPAYDDAPPGVEDLPLWAVTRQPGQALSQASVKRVFPRLAPVLDLPEGAPLPTSSPLGTRLRQGGTDYVRVLDDAGVAIWQAVPEITATQRVPISNTGLVGVNAALTAVITVPAADVPYRVTFEATGVTGNAESARTIAWDWDSTPGAATNSTRSDPSKRITVPGKQYAAITSTLSMDLPAGVDATARLMYRADNNGQNHGAVIWRRTRIV